MDQKKINIHLKILKSYQGIKDQRSQDPRGKKKCTEVSPDFPLKAFANSQAMAEKLNKLVVLWG